jgi:imidazolonepropionase-like amidohydrolase
MSILITNAQVFDGTGSARRRADVLVEGNLIKRIADHIEAPSGARIIDAASATLMPGLVDGHTHLGLGSTVEHKSPRTEPEEEQALVISHNARVMLDHGFTSIYSGGNRRPRVEVALRKAISEGWMPGPRLRAASWEVSADTMQAPSATLKPVSSEGHRSAYERAPITDQVRKFVNDMADIGVDIVKMPITGESALMEYTSKLLEFQDVEVQAAGEVARDRKLWLTAHAHSPEGMQMAIRAGFRVIYHHTYIDDETIAMAKNANDPVYFAPSPGSFWMFENVPTPPSAGMEVDVGKASLCEVVPKMIAAGLPVVIGSDYGFGFNPIGWNAKDLELFVNWFGMSPSEALRCATETGGKLMGVANLGLVREGYLADLLLVEGDPTANVGLLRDPANLSMIMKDGQLYKLSAKRQSGCTTAPVAE